MRANYKVELASGIFLLLGIAAMVWLATTATDFGQDIGKETYSITARFQNVADLRDRAPVKIGGVTVGMVESIALDPVTFEAVVTMNIATRFYEIPSDTGASVLTSCGCMLPSIRVSASSSKNSVTCSLVVSP